jgi:methylthioribose-1-phosphate isomerase
MSAPPIPASIEWRGDAEGELVLLDQTRLPGERVLLTLHDAHGVADAIRRLAVRGAPAIGVAAAYGLYLGVRAERPLPAAFLDCARKVAAMLLATRPTAVNLGWALDRCLARARAQPTLAALFDEAAAIHRDDIACCRRLGEHGAELVRDGARVLTHCNTGRLATAGDGTALAVLFAAARAGRRFTVLADETRPLLQGARLTALELHAAGIPVQVLPDSAAAGLIARGEVDLALVGADRVARNGDFANKVGTYGIALACAQHRVPFVVVAPLSTFDLSVPDGGHIPIEERAAEEVLQCAGVPIAPAGVGARNPAFDVTPARLVSAIITEDGILRPPWGEFADKIRLLTTPRVASNGAPPRSERS